jgi:carbonic anhydrase/acetyltransferase-like protein (isoleucine patch superfamily)
VSYNAADYGPDVRFDDPTYIHPSVQIYGKVALQKGASIWPNAVLRAENHAIDIGENTNIQDMVMVHVGYSTPTLVGKNCSITHRVVLHGCDIGDNCLIGIGAILMDGSKVGHNSILGAGAVLTDGQEIPANSIAVGAPARVIKTRNNYVANVWNAWIYAVNAQAFREGFHRRWDEAVFPPEAAEKRAEIQAEFDALKAAGDPIAAE